MTSSHPSHTTTTVRAADPQSPFRFPRGGNISKLLDWNAEWAENTAKTNPGLFPSIGVHQSPQVLWFGCSDSRVPETTVLGLQPGEVFVHRNIANVLPRGDLSSLSVLQYAVEVIKVDHVVVCGHYGCGGVNAALGNKCLGLIDAWLQNVRDVRKKYEKELKSLNEKERSRRLVELNVLEQLRGLRRNTNVRRAEEERGLKVYGWVFDVGTGRISQLELPKDDEEEDDCVYKLE